MVGDLVGGTTVLDVPIRPATTTVPGTYAYPTSSSFTAGSFDITRFQVLTKDGVVYLRTTVRTLTPTFGNTIGAQMLDIFVHTADAAPTSTAAPFPSRNYTIARPDAWSQRLEVQGFASPVWVDANGNAQGTVTAVVSSTITNTITVAVPESALGTPTSGWSFAVVLTGQDGFSPDQARAFAPTPQDFAFGVCQPGGSSPICAVDPGNGAEGDGRHHAERCQPSDRTRSDARAGGDPRRTRAVSVADANGPIADADIVLVRA